MNRRSFMRRVMGLAAAMMINPAFNWIEISRVMTEREFLKMVNFGVLYGTGSTRLGKMFLESIIPHGIQDMDLRQVEMRVVANMKGYKE